ncbi:MAG TPA: HDOD domain-containing protein, partial [Planctomycetaceae bacterium]
LTQDFLLPVLAKELHLFYSSTIERLALGGPDLVERERAALGWDHAEASGHVMFGWSFPDDLVCCVRLHHRPDAVTTDPRLSRSAAAAAALAALLPGPVRQCPDGAEQLDALLRERYGLNAAELAAAVDAQMAEQMRPAPGDVPLAERLRQAMPAAV